MPAELLHSRRIASHNDKIFEIFTMNEALTKRGKHHKNLLCGFTNRWHIEYFQGIQEVFCNIRRKESKPDIEIGEVVVVKDSNIARQMWKLAHRTRSTLKVQMDKFEKLL